GAALVHDQFDVSLRLAAADRAHRNQQKPFHHATAATTFFAASVKSVAVWSVGSSPRAPARISRAFSTLVPSSRTTTGTLNPICRPAFTNASAMTSHLAIPPKMLTRIPFTFSSERMIENASTAPSGVTDTPTSRK